MSGGSEVQFGGGGDVDACGLPSGTSPGVGLGSTEAVDGLVTGCDARVVGMVRDAEAPAEAGAETAPTCGAHAVTASEEARTQVHRRMPPRTP